MYIIAILPTVATADATVPTHSLNTIDFPGMNHVDCLTKCLLIDVYPAPSTRVACTLHRRIESERCPF